MIYQRSFTLQHFSTVSPALRACHTYPGYVHTFVDHPSLNPDSTSHIMSAARLAKIEAFLDLHIPLPRLGRISFGNYPSTYADIPAFLATNPKDKAVGREFSDYKLKCWVAEVDGGGA
jgi:hypothetical protein